MTIPGRLRRSLGLAALVVLSALLYGYDFVGGPNNSAQTFPFILKLLDPSLYPTDAYVRTAVYFPSFFPQVMAWTSRFLTLPQAYFVVYFALKYFLFEVVFALADRLFSDETTNWLACLLFAFSPLANVWSLLGDDPLIKTSLYQTTVAGPLCLWAILLFLRERFAASFLVLAAAYLFNGLIANFVLVLFAFAGARRPRRVFTGWLVFALAFGPWLLWYFHLPKYPGGAGPQILTILKMWYPGHYFPSSWTADKWLRIAVCGGFFAFVFHEGLRRCRDARVVKDFLAAFAAMWAVAAVAGLAGRWPAVVFLQFFRSDAFFISFGLIFAAAALARRFADGLLRSSAAAGLASLALVEVNVPFVAAPSFLLFAATERLRGRVRSLFLVAWLGACLLWTLLYPESTVKEVAVAVFLGAAFFAGAAQRVSKRRRLPLAFAVAALALAQHAGLMAYRAATGEFSNAVDTERDWEDLQRWVAASTPIDAVFITPPYLTGFRVLSRRAAFVEWLDGAAMHWAPGFEREWIDRLSRLGLFQHDLGRLLEATSSASMPYQLVRRRYESLPRTALESIRDDYGAGYVVQEVPGALSYPVRYRNHGFVLYALP